MNCTFYKSLYPAKDRTKEAKGKWSQMERETSQYEKEVLKEI